MPTDQQKKLAEIMTNVVGGLQVMAVQINEVSKANQGDEIVDQLLDALITAHKYTVEQCGRAVDFVREEMDREE
jgi:hypothetical protein